MGPELALQVDLSSLARFGTGKRGAYSLTDVLEFGGPELFC
jgi:hypothetical protein